MLNERRQQFTWKVGVRQFGCALIAVVLLASAAWAQPNWRPTITFPDDPYRVVGESAANPDWVKFTIKVADPTMVYYQDSNLYTFHYDFVTRELEGYIGISLEEFERIALYGQDQELVLGAVLMPASGYYPHPEIPEYGIQLIRYDPYSLDDIVSYFNLVRSTVIADPDVQAFYFPTYEQWDFAQENAEWLATQGVIVSSPSRWADGNAIYSPGWALGQLKFFPGDEIADAYQSGALLPGDILLTDGVPAELPILAGIMTLTPSTPNSHVVILANDYSVPFVYLAIAEDAQLAQELVGHRIVLRAYSNGNVSETRLIDVEGVLTDAQIAEILLLKELPPLDIQPMEPYGAYSQNTVELTLRDMPYFGGKASNYGFLRRAIPDNNPRALGLSFDVWNAFMDQMLINGNTLREEIAQTLEGYTWPPDMGQLADDLDYVRDLIENKNEEVPTIIPPELAAAILEILQDPQYDFNKYEKIRFRSSTNVEDSDQFTGAGLYESYSGCLLDDLDDDDEGPSWCDDEEENERGVFRAIRKVFASFYFDNAFLERLRRSVDPNEVGMAILVHHSFPDEFELANGVATYQRTGPSNASVYLVTQLGAVSVTNPEGGAIPEEVRVVITPSGMSAEVLRYSSLVQLGDTVMEYEEDYFELAGLMQIVANDYAAAIGEEQFLLDYEFKKLLPGGAAMPQGGMDVDQVRRIPAPETQLITPFLINVPEEYVTFQGEYGDVFANHRLKSQWRLATQNLWMNPENLASSFYADTRLEYTDGCWTRLYADLLPEFPEASHRYDGELEQATDEWSFNFLTNPRRYALLTPDVPALVPTTESPMLTLSDLGYPFVTVTYDEPVPTRNGEDPAWTTTDTIRLAPRPEPQPDDILQDRLFSTDTSRVVIHSQFYWPQPHGIVIWTAPLVQWVETTITGLTHETIVLHGWYSQTYRPGHHNIHEYFIFEPRLEPGISQSILDELTSIRIQYVYVEGSPYPDDPVEMYFYDDINCEEIPCTSNLDCSWGSYERYCRKAWGDCDGEGVCAPVPQACIDIWDPVCGCDGRTYSNACYAAMAGVSVDYDGECATPCSDNSDCSASYYCAKAVGDCYGEGTCQPRPDICLDVWIPVCGCDGRTYSNGCYAAREGVSVDYDGECHAPCDDNLDCSATSYCAKAIGDCDGHGTCESRPDICLDVWIPVCGCDGRTYSNACYAARAGVSIDYNGECGPPCEDNLDCSKSHYCKKDIGDCPGKGVCELRPVACPDVWDPVCGCDGKTYSNACEAAAAGVSIDYEGECAVPCKDNLDCSKSHYCKKAVGDCEGEGTCQLRPVVCPDVWDPVCGCDGKTYSNACVAAAAGVSIDYEGECAVPCKDNLDCSKSHYCAKAVGDCEGEGTCQLRPVACIDVWKPVCGCDGKTYSNACYAAMAGVSIDYEGSCKPGISEHP